MHFGVPPRRQQRRNRDVKKMIPLTHGHLMIDLEVPNKLIIPERGREESLYCRYTGVTCDPDDFSTNNYFLRQNISGRETEIAICITMYNEDEVLLCRTLYGVMCNIRELCAGNQVVHGNCGAFLGKDAWKKVVVVIVADGRRHIHPRVLDCLAILGVYQPGRHMSNTILGEQVTAHLFEYTATMALDASIQFQLMTPTQIVFCMKEKNQKKINSHRWFFNAFAKLLQPKVCVLIDVGTRPASKSIYHLWKTFDLNSNVGGACGEVAVYKGPQWRELLNPLVAAQNFEYKMSNILDKPLESTLGYITVLPGAFSAYRYIALQNDNTERGPLASYFRGEVAGFGHQQGIFSSNMCMCCRGLHRILCFELVAKHGHDWILRYVKSAVGETDVPHSLTEFISQRRRWLNGSLFASVYALAHFPQILRSDHSVARKTALMIETGYNFLNLCFSCGLFSICHGNKPKASQWKYKGAAISFAAVSAYMIVCAIFCAIQVAHSGKTGPYSKLVLSILCTFGLWCGASMLALDPAHLLTSAIPYMLLSPTYIIILNTFAFSNLDDISWGTKEQVRSEDDLGVVKSKIRGTQNVVEVELPSTEEKDVDALYVEALENLKTRKPKDPPPLDVHAAQMQEAKDYYANIRTNVLLFWVLSNALLVVSILGVGNATATFSDDPSGQRTRAYMTCVLIFVAISSAIRFFGSTVYLVTMLFTG
ncbi:glycosyltransferase family 2 protein [Cantharellus anzutake]|uniref:glycosyltransferase family 2 protein n=1 Tax=Cantharellus anzutake TaxID=1750568 RepID=UPI001905083F|nr:glycosyltransferase family 2 protein [Cantharellus anzutake]KAF8331087.1 glycosyltransferase family 2 protein [Cantharellus anzutake]